MSSFDLAKFLWISRALLGGARAPAGIVWSAPTSVLWSVSGPVVGQGDLQAHADSDGVLTYDPSAGASLEPGDHVIRIVTAATEAFEPGAFEARLTVLPAPATINWPVPPDVPHRPGGVLVDPHLKAQVDPAAAGLLHVPPPGTLLPAGTHTLQASVADTVHYLPASASVTFRVVEIQVPIDFQGHLFTAEVKPGGKVVGGHTIVSGLVRVKPGTATPPNSEGVYQAQIEVEDPGNPGTFIAKTNNGGVSSLFPDAWSEDRIQVEVQGAFDAWTLANPTVTAGKWSAVTPGGVKVEGWLAPKVTVYPIY